MRGANDSTPTWVSSYWAFSDQPHLERLLLLVVSIIYILTLMGKTEIILLSYFNPKLHTPMYFFLSNLSFLDLCFTTSVVPQMLWNLKGLTRPLATLVVIQLVCCSGAGLHGVCPADCYGLWPLQRYLSTPPLWSDHAPKSFSSN